jgi:hypothetical protein
MVGDNSSGNSNSGSSSSNSKQYNVNGTTYHAKLVEEGPCEIGRGKYWFLGGTGITGEFRVTTGILADGTQEAIYHTRF